MAESRPVPERQYAGGMHVEVEVDDIVAEHERLRVLGVKVGDISEKPRGARKFTFTDPDGYPWSYGQLSNSQSS